MVGWFAGMLVNYLADVLPENRKLAIAFCPNCHAPQSWRYYIWWLQRCPECKVSRSKRTYLIGIFFILIGAFLSEAKLADIGIFSGMILAIYLAVVVVIDIEQRLILHQVSLIGVVICLVYGIWLHGIKSTLIGGAAGFVSMLVIYYAGIGYVRLLAWLGRPTDEVALGYGDVNLSGVIGLLLGWPGIGAGLMITILLSGFVSLLFMLVMMLRRQYRADLALPFGPFMVASAVILIYLKDMLYWIWSLI